MIVALICAAAVIIALGLLGFLAVGLLGRIKRLDGELVRSREHAQAIETLMAQAPGTSD
ncbi:MAG: hypothetical protein WCB04_04215 [Mycobacteriales bacterium]